jgi:uncharacterized membrane protein (UPF0136 family)
MPTVNKDVAIELFLYGLILAVFGLIGYSQKANLPLALLAAGVIGGISVAVLAVLAIQGHRVRNWSIAIVSIIFLCLLAQAALSWYHVVHDSSNKGTPLILTILSFFALGQLASLVRN